MTYVVTVPQRDPSLTVHFRPEVVVVFSPEKPRSSTGGNSTSTGKGKPYCFIMAVNSCAVSRPTTDVVQPVSMITQPNGIDAKRISKGCPSLIM